MCVEREKSALPAAFQPMQMKEVEEHIEQRKRDITLIPKKRDFATHYKFIKVKNKSDKLLSDYQYFNIKKAKSVNNKKGTTYLVKECRKFHLNKVIRQLTLNEV